MPRIILCGLLVWFITGALPAPARATLGQNVQSVASDQQLLGAGPPATVEQASGYSIQQFTTSSGAVVREYLSASGLVFAVSWRGPIPPNLSVLLGDYFSQYKTAAARQTGPMIQRPNSVQAGDLMVQTGGHMGALWGRAYVPSLLPAGVSVEGIQ